jgi:hypothetical protein
LGKPGDFAKILSKREWRHLHFKSHAIAATIVKFSNDDLVSFFGSRLEYFASSLPNEAPVQPNMLASLLHASPNLKSLHLALGELPSFSDVSDYVKVISEFGKKLEHLSNCQERGQPSRFFIEDSSVVKLLYQELFLLKEFPCMFADSVAPYPPELKEYLYKGSKTHLSIGQHPFWKTSFPEKRRRFSLTTLKDESKEGETKLGPVAPVLVHSFREWSFEDVFEIIQNSRMWKVIHVDLPNSLHVSRDQLMFLRGYCPHLEQLTLCAPLFASDVAFGDLLDFLGGPSLKRLFLGSCSAEEFTVWKHVSKTDVLQLFQKANEKKIYVHLNIVLDNLSVDDLSLVIYGAAKLEKVGGAQVKFLIPSKIAVEFLSRKGHLEKNLPKRYTFQPLGQLLSFGPGEGLAGFPFLATGGHTLSSSTSKETFWSISIF